MNEIKVSKKMSAANRETLANGIVIKLGEIVKAYKQDVLNSPAYLEHKTEKISDFIAKLMDIDMRLETNVLAPYAVISEHLHEIDEELSSLGVRKIRRSTSSSPWSLVKKTSNSPVNRKLDIDAEKETYEAELEREYMRNLDYPLHKFNTDTCSRSKALKREIEFDILNSDEQEPGLLGAQLLTKYTKKLLPYRE